MRKPQCYCECRLHGNTGYNGSLARSRCNSCHSVRKATGLSVGNVQAILDRSSNAGKNIISTGVGSKSAVCLSMTNTFPQGPRSIIVYQFMIQTQKGFNERLFILTRTHSMQIFEKILFCVWRTLAVILCQIFVSVHDCLESEYCPENLQVWESLSCPVSCGGGTDRCH